MYESPIHVYIHRTMQDLNEAMWEEAWKETWRLNIRIDRDELIKALKYDRDQYEKGYDDGYKEAVRWISAKKRRPSCDGNYLVVTKYFGENFPRVALYDFARNRWRVFHGSCAENVTEYVTHWMELPPEPKEGDHV